MCGISWSQVNPKHKRRWREALTFPLICAWIDGWFNNRDAGDLRRHRAHYDAIVKGVATLISRACSWQWNLYALKMMGTEIRYFEMCIIWLNDLLKCFLMKDKKVPVFWWPGGTKIQDSRTHGIDIDFSENFASILDRLTDKVRWIFVKCDFRSIDFP